MYLKSMEKTRCDTGFYMDYQSVRYPVIFNILSATGGTSINDKMYFV